MRRGSLLGSMPSSHANPGDVVIVLGVPSPQFHSYFIAVNVTVTSRPNSVTVWVWVGLVTLTMVGMCLFV